MGRPGRKASANAKRRQTTRAGQGRREGGTAELVALKRRVTKREDLPMDPLGVLFGHGKIERELYDAGLRLEKAHAVCFGTGAAALRDIYGLQMTMASTGGRRAALSGPVGEEAQKREERTQREYDRLAEALRRCGSAVAAATLGIATRPYAGAWLAVGLVDPARPWTARHDTRLALIKEGLSAIGKLGSKPL